MNTLISQISAESVGTTVTLAGWIQNIRSSGKVAFIELRDGSGYMQCVVEPNSEKHTPILEVPFSQKTGDCYMLTPTDNPPQEGKKTIQRDHVDCIVKHRSEEKYLFLKRKVNGRLDFVGGGLDGLSPIHAGFKEITEETGYTDIKLVYQIPEKTKGSFYHARKDLNVTGYDYPVVYKLNSDAQQSIEKHESDAHDIVWLTEEEVSQQGINFTKVIWSLYKHYNYSYTTKGIATDHFAELSSLGQESSISLTGTVSKHPKKDEYELQVSDYTIFGHAKDYPLGTKSDHGIDFLLDQRHLHLRSKSQVAIQKVRDTIIHATYDWMRDHGFTKIDSPIFTPSACEGTTELYETKHINDEMMYLTQSGQLYLEAAIAGVGRCYDFGPVFRAEHCKTRRHLNEFWMMDAEIPFVQQEGNMQVQEQLVQYIIEQVLAKNEKDLLTLGTDIEGLRAIQLPYRRITHAEWCQELEAMGFEVPADGDIGSDLEMQYCQKQTQPLFVTNFPVGQKAFYFKEDPNLPGTVLGADLLAPGDCGEVIGGGTREDDYQKLYDKLIEHKLPLEEFQRYLDTRKYGSVPHAGFGYGLERLVRWLCGLHHVRETIPFPRYNNRIRP